MIKHHKIKINVIILIGSYGNVKLIDSIIRLKEMLYIGEPWSEIQGFLFQKP